MGMKEQIIIEMLTDACLNASAYFNGMAQNGGGFGLPKREDDLRQQLCNAASAAKGTIFCGNLTRTHEAQAAIDEIKAIKD